QEHRLRGKLGVAPIGLRQDGGDGGGGHGHDNQGDADDQGVLYREEHQNSPGEQRQEQQAQKGGGEDVPVPEQGGDASAGEVHTDDQHGQRSGHVGQIGERGVDHLGNGNLGGIEDETQQGGSVDHREQDGPPGDRGRIPGGAAVHADEGGPGGVGQQVEGDAQKDGQDQPLLPKEGQGDGKAHKTVVVEGTGEGPQPTPLPGDAERPGQQGADDSVQDVEGQAQD